MDILKNFQSIITQIERNFQQDFTNYIKKEWGILYYDPSNPEAHDSNHALITDLNGNLDEIISEIESFYKSKKLNPRIFPAFIKNEFSILKPYLNKYNFNLKHDGKKYIANSCERISGSVYE